MMLIDIIRRLKYDNILEKWLICNTIYFFINNNLNNHTIKYDIKVAIAAPYAPKNGINIKFIAMFKAAPIMVDFAYIFESLFAAYIVPKKPDNAPNNIANNRNGTYFHAI